MAQLLTCIECNKSYSSTLQRCPHCSSKYPRGCICYFCSRVSKAEKVRPVGYGRFRPQWSPFSNDGGPSLPEYQEFACFECLGQIEAQSEENKLYRCPTCALEQPAENRNCSNCGESLSTFLLCLICGAHIFAPEAIRKSKDTSFICGYHKFCASKKRHLVEKDPRCFIATVAFGSVLAPEVIILREFRDDVLLSYKLGKIFVRFYNFISPHLASVIAKSALLKECVKILFLAPILSLIRILKR